jgi:hypothetical protein
MAAQKKGTGLSFARPNERTEGRSDRIFIIKE